MILKIEIDTSGEAFKGREIEEVNNTLDLVKTLARTALSGDRVQPIPKRTIICDSNINPCGTVSYE